MIPENFELTPQQREVFYYLAHGLSIASTAYILHLNYLCVRNISRLVRSMLSTPDYIEACNLLVSAGYISVTPESVRKVSHKLFASKYKKDFPYCLLFEIPIFGFSIKISRVF